jgi:type IV secretion system protein TrbE
MAWGLRELRQEPDRLGHVLYWQQLLEPGDVVWQNDHSLFSVLSYRGPDMESADAYELMSLHARFHGAVLMTLGAGWTIQGEERRHPAPPYAVSTWAQPVAALVDEERRDQVGTPGTHFHTSYRLILTWQIPRSLGSWWQRVWWEHIPQGHAQTDVVTNFREEVSRIRQQCEVLFADVALLSGTSLMTYLHSRVSEHAQASVEVPDPAWWLNYDLTDTPFYAGVTPKLGNLWLRPIVVKNKGKQTCMPPTSYPGILDVLHDLPLEYCYSWRWIPLSHAAAQKELSDLENRFRSQEQSASTQARNKVSRTKSDKIEQGARANADAMSEARGLLQQGLVQWGYVSLTVLVWDTDFAAAEAKRELVEQALRSKGFLASVEVIDAVGVLLSTLPGDSYNNVERPMVTSMNAGHFFPLTSVDAGVQWVPHLNGPALMIGTARGQTPYGITTYDSDVGDFAFVAPKGAGKSAATVLMELQHGRYARSRVVVLDKGQSHKAATLAMNGTWVDLSPTTMQPLQPFARIDEPGERAWAVGLVEDMMELEGLERTPTLTNLLEEGMLSLAGFPVEQRTMSGLRGLVQASQVRDVLLRYTVDGSFPVLDGDVDWLHITHWTCFEMEALLDDYAHFVAPVAKVLCRRVETALDGAPTFITLEECHAYFQVETLARRLLSWLKTFRRKNALLGFLTQNLWDLKRSPVGLEIIQACPTRFYGANPHAIEGGETGTMALYQEFGLTRRHCEIIASLVPKLEVYIQGPRERRRRVKLEMGPATLAFCGRSRQEDLARMATVAEECRGPFGVEWLHSEGLSTLANLLGEAYGDESTNDDGEVVSAELALLETD